MLPRLLTPLCLILISGFVDNLFAAGAIIKVDTIAPGDLTLVLKDFNSATPQHSSLSANNPTPAPVWLSANDGYHTYEVSNATSDGKVYFATTPYDVQYYTHVRVRARSSSSSGSADIWPNNAVGSTTVGLGAFGTSFRESNQAWKDPANASIVTASNGGFRWDPNTIASATTTYDIDYVMVDMGRVVGFEFDVNEIADPLSTSQILQNWRNVTNRTTDYRIEDGALKGVTNHGDTYIQTNSSLNLDTDIYQFVEVRVKTNTNVKLQFFWAPTSMTFTESKSASITTTDDQWHTYLIDLTGEDTWAGTLDHFRVDIGSATNIPYEIDYIRFREIGVVPEPARVTLLFIAALSILRRRRSART